MVPCVLDLALQQCGSSLSSLRAASPRDHQALRAAKTLWDHMFERENDDDPARTAIIEAVAFAIGRERTWRWRWEVVLHDVMALAPETTTHRFLETVLPRFGAVEEAGRSAMESVVIGHRDNFLAILNPVAPSRRLLVSQRITIQVLLADFEEQLWLALDSVPGRSELLRYYGARKDKDAIDARVAELAEVLRGPHRTLESLIVLASLY